MGLPDAGLATYTDMPDRVEAIAQAVRKPLIADGDTGYGGLLNVYHTARGYEKAGGAAIQLEDQVISLSGDGGFTMLMGDLLTLTQMELPAKVVVFHVGGGLYFRPVRAQGRA